MLGLSPLLDSGTRVAVIGDRPDVAGPGGVVREPPYRPDRHGRVGAGRSGSVTGVSTDTADGEPVVVTGEPVTVTDVMVARFAEAVGAPSDEVPATLAAALTAEVQQVVMAHPRLRIDLSRTLHTAQSSQHHRPVRVGDVLTPTATVTGVRSARGGRMIGFDTVLTDATGEAVQTLSSSLLTAEVAR